MEAGCKALPILSGCVFAASLLATVAGLGACSDDSSGPGGQATTTASTPAAPAPNTTPLKLAPGFTYDQDALTPGFPEIATIRLGERLRIYYKGPWVPATLALLDEQDNVLTSLRLDLPPRGTVTGSLPTGLPFAKVRIASAAQSSNLPAFDRAIGFAEPELTVARLRDMGISESEKSTSDGRGIKTESWSGMMISHSTNLDPNFGRILFFSGTYSYGGVADEWKGEGPASDSHWLNQPARDAFANVPEQAPEKRPR